MIVQITVITSFNPGLDHAVTTAGDPAAGTAVSVIIVPVIAFLDSGPNHPVSADAQGAVVSAAI